MPGRGMAWRTTLVTVLAALAGCSPFPPGHLELDLDAAAAAEPPDAAGSADAAVGDACAPAANPCSADATCAPVAGTASCTCKPGFTGDGLTCTKTCTSALLFTDCPASGTSCSASIDWTFADEAAAELGIRVISVAPADETAFQAALAQGGFEVVIFESSRVNLADATATKLASWIDGGGRTIVTYWNLSSTTTGQTLRTALGVTTAGSYSSPREVYADPSSPSALFQRPEAVPTLVPSNVMATDGDDLTLTGGGFLAARTMSTTGPGAIAVTHTGRAVTLGFLSIGLVSPTPHDSDGDGKPDSQELYTNLLGYVCGY